MYVYREICTNILAEILAHFSNGGGVNQWRYLLDVLHQ